MSVPAPSICFRAAEELRFALELRQQRLGFQSIAAYMKWLIRLDCLGAEAAGLADAIQRIPEARHEDLDNAILRILEAPEAKRPRLAGILGDAIQRTLNPRARRDLQSGILQETFTTEAQQS